MIKILQVCYGSFVKAGVQNVIMTIVRNADKQYHHDVLLFSSRKAYYDEEFEQYGSIHRIPCDIPKRKIQRLLSYSIRPVRQFVGAWRLLKREHYDCIHIHTGFEAGPILLAAKCAGVKNVVVHAHNTASPEKRMLATKVYRAIGKKLIHWIATKRVGCSEEANEYLFNNDPSIVINNPVDLQMFSGKKYPEHVKNDEIKLINVGRYGFQKNQSFCIELCDYFNKNGRDCSLKLVGFGKEKDDLLRLIEEKGLKHRVTLVDGSSADIAKEMSEADVFLFPSRFEGLGIVLIEAQAIGLPCVASDVVPRRADVGVCEFVPLDASIESWATMIQRAYRKRNTTDAVPDANLISSFHEKEVARAYNALYGGMV